MAVFLLLSQASQDNKNYQTIYTFLYSAERSNFMLKELKATHTGQSPPAPKEGDLFKTIETHGKVFEIRYGFYEECDRHHKYAEPMEIYPDFINRPQYTDDGIPFATAMQNPCIYFNGKRDDNTTCEECAFYKQCDELLGICLCPMNRLVTADRQNE